MNRKRVGAGRGTYTSPKERKWISQFRVKPQAVKNAKWKPVFQAATGAKLAER